VVAPRRSGLHLHDVEYDNTLAVLSAPVGEITRKL
jgi:hypothetical protein